MAKYLTKVDCHVGGAFYAAGSVIDYVGTDHGQPDPVNWEKVKPAKPVKADVPLEPVKDEEDSSSDDGEGEHV